MRILCVSGHEDDAFLSLGSVSVLLLIWRMGWGLLLHFCLAKPVFFLHSGEPCVVLCLTGSQAQFFSLEMLKG